MVAQEAFVPEHMMVVALAVLAANAIAALAHQAFLTLAVAVVLADIPAQAARVKMALALRLPLLPDVVLVVAVVAVVFTAAALAPVLAVAVVVLAFMGKAQMERQALQAQTATDGAAQAAQTARRVLLVLAGAMVATLAAGRAVSVSDRLVALMVELEPTEQFVSSGPATLALSHQPALVHPNL